jgi:hypothetical protein
MLASGDQAARDRQRTRDKEAILDETTRDQPSPAAGSKHPGSPQGKVIGAVEPVQVEATTAALVAAGFPAVQIDVVTADALAEIEAPLDRPGIGGLVGRFLLSMGDDLDELERFRDELEVGHVLVGVPAQGDEAVHRVRDILREHGGHGIVYYGRWTITTFDE